MAKRAAKTATSDPTATRLKTAQHEISTLKHRVRLLELSGNKNVKVVTKQGMVFDKQKGQIESLQSVVTLQSRDLRTALAELKELRKAFRVLITNSLKEETMPEVEAADEEEEDDGEDTESVEDGDGDDDEEEEDDEETGDTGE